MAKAYLGKISAIVTANTSDFNSKLNASAKEVRTFAAAMDSTLKSASSSAQASLRGIYTESQKVSRALQAAATTRLKFEGYDKKTFAELNAAVETFKRIQQASVAVNEPLVRAAQTIDKLSAKVQSAFEPAMASAQKSAEFLSAALARGGIVGEKSFERIRLKAEQAAAAADRLAEASQIASSGPRGNELAFQDPRLRDSLAASAAVRQRAASSPAGVLESGSVGKLVAQLTQVDNLAVATKAEIESNKILRIDTTAAEKRLRDLQLTSSRVRDSISSELDRANTGFTTRRADADRGSLGLFGRPAGTEEERALDAARKASEEYARLPQAGKAALAGLAGIAGGVADSVRDGTTSAAKLVAVLDILNAKIREQAPGASTGLIVRPPSAPPVPAASRGLGLFGSDNSTDEEKSIARAKRLSDAYAKLPESARTGLAGLAGIASRVANDVDAGRTKAENLSKVLDRIESSISSEKSFIPLGSLEKSAKDLKDIEKSLLAVRAAANFGTPLSEVFESAQIDSYKAKLRLLQDTLISSGVTSGEAAEAVSDYAAQLERAANTKGGLAAAAGEIGKAESRAISAVGNATPGGARALEQRLKRVGDIGRGAFGNLGLGVQQAVFALDDFFSVTGGLDQRIRAAGNNISQLGFVLGGTEGLITGVAVSITAQLVVALIKWQNAGVGTEDRLKSLNDALARQKSLVESLAQAFDGLGDSIGNLGFSKQAAESAKLQKSLDDLRSKFKESNEERLGGTDQEVQKQRGIIAAREKALEKTTDPGQRVLLQRQINDARRDEAGRLGAIADRPALSPQAAVQAAADARLRIRTSEINARFNAANGLGGPGGAASAGQREEARRRAIAQAQQESAVFGDRLGGAVQQAGGANEQVVRARQVIEAQQLEIQQSITTGIDALFDTANAERRRQLAALEEAKKSLESGVIAAAQDLAIDITEQSVRVAAQIGQSQDKVAQAIEEGVYGADLLGEVLNSLTTELQAAQDRAAKAGIKGDLSGVSDAEKEITTIQSLLSAREQEIAEIDATRVAVQNFNSVLDSFSSEADQIVSAARQEFEQAEAQNNFRGTVEDMRALEVASENLKSAMASQQAVREAVALDRDQAQFGESDLTRTEAAIAEIDELLKYRDSLPFQQREELIRERESLRAAADFEIQRDSASSGNALAKAREEALKADQIKRGFALQESPAERAGRELSEQLDDLDRSLVRLPDIDDDRDAAMRQRIAQDAMRQQAPAIFGMADQVQNAVIQGPSRAALQASDVTTMQGAAELNRLIRGDDSAKNVDTVELQKQSKSLERLVQIAEENGAPPGVFN